MLQRVLSDPGEELFGTTVPSHSTEPALRGVPPEQGRTGCRGEKQWLGVQPEGGSHDVLASHLGDELSRSFLLSIGLLMDKKRPSLCKVPLNQESISMLLVQERGGGGGEREGEEGCRALTLLLDVSIGEAEDVRAAVKVIHSSAHFARGDLL